MRSALLLALAVIVFSCSTYYQINYEFNNRFEQGQLESAEKFLKNNKTKRTKFLYYANRGTVNTLMGNYPESNVWLEKAYIYHQDYQRNYADEAASFLVNPTMVAYKAEDHEQLLLLYYKALNFLYLKDYESALVECRRLNDQLNALSDRYKSDNKYKRDAFIHNLMGIIYEASGDVNNAFIAYRNAYTIYKEDYVRLFDVPAPDQLKQDLMRTAHEMGFFTELDQFEREFDMKFIPKKSESELVFFWHNGLGPVKGEWSVNFAVQKGGDGFVTFANSEYGMSFPFPVSSSGDAGESSSLSDINVIRVAFPKYVERSPVYNKAYLSTKTMSYDLQVAEDVNKIAFKTLEERMLKEFSKGLLRAALKEAAEAQMRKESEGWGALLGAVNAFTEKADTRNWQTLPHTIYYARVPLNAGDNEVKLTMMDEIQGRPKIQTFNFTVAKGETTFQVYQSLDYRR